ncbi:discoidin domain-containing protein [Dactylosporangium cerinum]
MAALPGPVGAAAAYDGVEFAVAVDPERPRLLLDPTLTADPLAQAMAALPTRVRRVADLVPLGAGQGAGRLLASSVARLLGEPVHLVNGVPLHPPTGPITVFALDAHRRPVWAEPAWLLRVTPDGAEEVVASSPPHASLRPLDPATYSMDLGWQVRLSGGGIHAFPGPPLPPAKGRASLPEPLGTGRSLSFTVTAPGALVLDSSPDAPDSGLPGSAAAGSGAPGSGVAGSGASGFDGVSTGDDLPGHVASAAGSLADGATPTGGGITTGAASTGGGITTSAASAGGGSAAVATSTGGGSTTSTASTGGGITTSAASAGGGSAAVATSTGGGSTTSTASTGGGITTSAASAGGGSAAVATSTGGGTGPGPDDRAGVYRVVVGSRDETIDDLVWPPLSAMFTALLTDIPAAVDLVVEGKSSAWGGAAERELAERHPGNGVTSGQAREFQRCDLLPVQLPPAPADPTAVVRHARNGLALLAAAAVVVLLLAVAGAVTFWPRGGHGADLAGGSEPQTATVPGTAPGSAAGSAAIASGSASPRPSASASPRPSASTQASASASPGAPSTVASNPPLPLDTTTNVAAGRATSESSHTQAYRSDRVTDGDPMSYWESRNNALPQWVQVDLGGPVAVRRIVLRLPPSSDWPARTQTVTVLGSLDGSTFSTIAGGSCRFDAGNGQRATLGVSSGEHRYVRILISSNSIQPAGQLSSVEVYRG